MSSQIVSVEEGDVITVVPELVAEEYRTTVRIFGFRVPVLVSPNGIYVNFGAGTTEPSPPEVTLDAESELIE